MKVSREYHDHLLVANCDPDLVEQANSLLRMIEEAGESASGLRDGFVIEFGWAPLRLRIEKAEFIVYEPDYSNDVNQFVPSVSKTLRVVAEQAALLNSLGLEGVVARYNQGVALKREVLDLHRIYLHRRKPVSDRDSGWYIGPANNPGEPPESSQLDAIYVYHLLDVRPALLRVMALPLEYIAVFAGDQIEAVVNPSNRRVWPVS